MNVRSAGLRACLLVAVISGCGTVSASAPGGGGHPAGTPAAATPAAATPAAATPVPATPAAATCQRPADDTVTLASNGKSYCVRIGQRLAVYLQGTPSRPWLVPLASSDALKPVPDGAMSLRAGLTGESFAAARPGRVLITSIRRPCTAAMMGKNEAEASGSLPRVYPLGFCPAPGRFSVSVTVLRT
jgi:hypothetical protein